MHLLSQPANNNLANATDISALINAACTTSVYDNLIVLPLDGLALKAAVNKDQVQLQWAINPEINIASFIVERAKDGKVFDSIGRVGRTEAASNNYTFIDNNPSIGNSFYRLRTMDPDGHFSYSAIVPVTYHLSTKAVFTLFPNPTYASTATWLKIEGVTNNRAINGCLPVFLKTPCGFGLGKNL